MKIELTETLILSTSSPKNAKIEDILMFSEDAYDNIDKNEDFAGIKIRKAPQKAILPISKDIAGKVKATLEKYT